MAWVWGHLGYFGAVVFTYEHQIGITKYAIVSKIPGNGIAAREMVRWTVQVERPFCAHRGFMIWSIGDFL